VGAVIPIRGVLGDQQAALFGQGCRTSGTTKYTFGTGGFLLANTGTRIRRASSDFLTTVAWQRVTRVTYATEASAYTAGAAIAWFRDIGVLRDAAESAVLAASVRDPGDVVFLPALQGLGAPYWNSDAHGALLGLRRSTTRAHLARAVLEAVAFQAADAIVRIPETGRTIRVDGAAAQNDVLIQLLADASGRTVERPAMTEATALGAAQLAAAAVGWDEHETAGPIARFRPRRDPALAQRFRRWRAAMAELTS
jgi:glycerol kinase